MAETRIKINQDGDYYIEFPEELMKDLGWEIGDTLIWEHTYISHDDYEGEGFVVRKKDE